jgi:NAD(P)-dependent dehydrogenase (short-subunit alcohol dehydrogenase family)
MQQRMEDLTGRVAVVIGGGSGIGRGIALGLATEGMRVVVADIDAASAEGVRDEIAGAGGTATSSQVDGTDWQSLGRLAGGTGAEHGAVHVLSSNVGVVADLPVASASEAEANRLHILTHPSSRGLVEARHDALVDDFAFFAEG